MKYLDFEGDLQTALTAAIADKQVCARLQRIFSNAEFVERAPRFCSWVTDACDSGNGQRIDLFDWSDGAVANSVTVIVGFVSQDWGDSPLIREFICAALRLTSRAVCGRLAVPHG
ncbi:MAG: hypothetical protein JWP89_2681 [Schlesneria sp.]|nr:hypothetical protein [Schlesneria sp.]